jgi:hypothetical protein
MTANYWRLRSGSKPAGVERCEAWVTQLQRIAGPRPAPQKGGPRRDPARDQLEDDGVAALKRARLT